jgi:hypothetical protein
LITDTELDVTKFEIKGDPPMPTPLISTELVPLRAFKGTYIPPVKEEIDFILPDKRVSKITPPKEVFTFTEGMKMPAKRARKWKHHAFCFCCISNGPVLLPCNYCPRMYHEECLENKWDGPYNEYTKMAWFVVNFTRL